MTQSTLSEADTRAKLIDPALHSRGWTENLIRREETAGTVDIVAGQPRRQAKGRTDYTLRVLSSQGAQPVAIAVIEAKAERFPATHGFQQAKAYGSSKRLNVPFVYSSNGHQFVEFDAFTGLTHAPRSLSEFPTPDELRARYEVQKGFSLDSSEAKPLAVPYSRGQESGRRYYQDAAIRATLERIARGENRALLSLATGAGKTFIAVHLLKKIAEAGQLRRALFICDRDELRTQGLAAFQNEFGNDAAPASTNNPQLNARIIVATYQTLGVDRDDSDASFLTRHYPQNYFSHIIIDECHRSAWGKWSEVLTRNADAVQIGLTATPRELEFAEHSGEAQQDMQISADNIRYFGEPAYEYTIGQGIEDGYLAAMEIIKSDIFLNLQPKDERETGATTSDFEGRVIRDAITGEQLTIAEARARYDASSFESMLMIPERVQAMCKDLFERLVATGGPEQKTIIFCARDMHADAVAIEMNNLYAEWCNAQGRARLDDYAFKCTAESGKEYVSEIRGSTRRHFIAATVDLLSTGVDVPPVKNVVFFKYVSSPIAFYQMVGRGTRIHPPSNKLMFRVYDYTNATRLFGEDFITKFVKADDEKKGTDCPPPDPPERAIVVEGFDVRVSDAGTYIMTTNDDGEAVPVTLDEYKQRLAARLVEEIPALDDFRETWVEPERRRELFGHLPDSGRSPQIVRTLTDMEDFDLFDVLVEIGYGQAAKTRLERAESFGYKNGPWLDDMPRRAAEAIRAIASQFARDGTDTLENPAIFRTPEVVKAGGMNALSEYDRPAETLKETKKRMFSA